MSKYVRIEFYDNGEWIDTRKFDTTQSALTWLRENGYKLQTDRFRYGVNYYVKEEENTQDAKGE